MQNELNDLLTKAKGHLKEETSTIAYKTWLENLEIANATNNEIVLLVNNAFTKEAVETRYLELIVNVFNFITNKNYTVSIITKDEYMKQNNVNELYFAQDNNNIPQNSSLNPNYTFDNFVVGESNSFAHAAALAVAEAPATAYNPLFLYGGVGLGKTHLMQAIGNSILQRINSTNILYVTSEKFTNQLINAIKDGKSEHFRSKYRNIDILLIDDIQFIAGKERVQEEFFHTFNALRDDGKQIILSSDKPPKDIPGLEDRLKSRFEWGIIADISAPDYETRLAILRKKAQTENIIIDDAILATIANRINSNIRELEGTLNKLIAEASLRHSQITMEMAERAINTIVAHQDKVISSEFIQETIAKYFNVSVKDLISTKRSQDISHPRQIAMYLCRAVAQLSFPQIGKDFGNRDHTTVMHAYDKIEKEIKTNSNNTKMIVESVKNILLSQE